MGRKEKGVKEKYQRDLKRETEREREWRRPTPLSQNQKLPATQTHTHRASQPNTQIHGTEILRYWGKLPLQQEREGESERVRTKETAGMAGHGRKRRIGNCDSDSDSRASERASPISLASEKQATYLNLRAAGIALSRWLLIVTSTTHSQLFTRFDSANCSSSQWLFRIPYRNRIV